MPKLRAALPFFLALLLFLLNSLAVLSGWLETPDGYVHLLQVDNSDNAIYESWLRSSESRFLHPNYQAPWQTRPAVMTPLFYLIARLSNFAGVALDWGWLLAQFGVHVATAYALFAALRAFMKSRREIRAALLVMVLAVPISSLLVLPSVFVPLDRLGVPPLPGLGSFVWLSSDGFLHGISGSILVTFGTGATIAAFACLARYLETEKRRHLAGAGVAVLLCGLVHPYEPYLIVAAGCVTLLVWRGANWRRSLPEVLVLGSAGALGIAPMAVSAWLNPWVWDAAEVTRWTPPNPLELLAILGVPAIISCALFVFRRRMASPTDLLLQSWIAFTLIGIYLPFIPWTQHLLDGFHYGVAMLLVRQLVQTPSAGRILDRHRGLAMATIGALLVLSLGAYGAYYIRSWKDGRLPDPERLFTSVVARDDVEARIWLQENADSSDLVIAPLKRATWFSAVPMHSFAGNYLFSITFPEQKRLSGDFFSGSMDREATGTFLAEYGIRWVVLPEGSPARGHLETARERARVGRWSILEIEGNEMKPYPGVVR